MQGEFYCLGRQVTSQTGLLGYIDDSHAIRIYDLADLWVIKIKKPMILCERSTSKSSEQSMKRRSQQEHEEGLFNL